jgi:rare lipoprotein A
MQSAGASWYDDSGPTACEAHYALGVANKTLPCGTRVEICAARCAVVTVQDRGPFVEGREWDLNVGAKEAIGFGDTGEVRTRVLS